MDERPRSVVGQGIAFVGRTESRRLAVVFGTPVVFAVLTWEQNVIGTTVVLLAVGLAAVLYTRPTAQKTVAASAYATGVLLIGLVLLELYWNWAQAGNRTYMAIVLENLWQPVTGAVLIGLGLWLRRLEG